MAASRRSTIATRLTLEGGAEVKSQLDAIGVTASRRLSAGTSASRGMSNALQNLSFQVNDVFTSIASGGGVMRTFAQQGGQIFQIFQQGDITVGGLTKRLIGMITPMRALAGLGAAAAAGIGVFALRANDAESAERQLDVTLKAVARTGLPQVLSGGGPNGISRGVDKTAQDLVKAARSMKDAGLSMDEAKQKFEDALRLGIPSGRVEEITRIAQDLKAGLGDIDFAKAVKGGVEPLREIARQLGIISTTSTPAQDGLRTVDSLVRAIGEKVKGFDRQALSPLGESARDINVEFNDILNNLDVFFKEGIVNLVNTVKAGLEVYNAAFEVIRARLAQPDPFGIAAAATRTVTAVQQLFATMGETVMATLVAAFSAVNPFEALVGFAQSAVSTITGWLQGIANFVAQIARAISSLGSASSPEFTAPIPPGPAIAGNAAGGLIRGPGTGISDSILARLSNGEFIVNAAATRAYLPLLRAINSFQQPRILHPKGFAMGGIAGALSPGRADSIGRAAVSRGGWPRSPGGQFGTIVLNLDRQSFTAHAEVDVFESLRKVASRKSLVSAGRKASHIGGRRYGG